MREKMKYNSETFEKSKKIFHFKKTLFIASSFLKQFKQEEKMCE